MLVRRSFTFYKAEPGGLDGGDQTGQELVSQLSGSGSAIGVFVTATKVFREESFVTVVARLKKLSGGRLAFTLTEDLRSRILAKGGLLGETVNLTGVALDVITPSRGSPQFIIPKSLVKQRGYKPGGGAVVQVPTPGGDAIENQARVRMMAARARTLFNTGSRATPPGQYPGWYDGFPGLEETAEAEEPLPTVKSLNRMEATWEVLLFRDGRRVPEPSRGIKRAWGSFKRHERARSILRVEGDELEAGIGKYTRGAHYVVTGGE